MATYYVQTRSGQLRRIDASSAEHAAALISSEERETVRSVRAAKPLIAPAGNLRGRGELSSSEVEAGTSYCIINR